MTAVFLSSFNTFGFHGKSLIRAEEMSNEEIVHQPEYVSNERNAAEPEESRDTNADTVPGDTNQVLDNLPVNGDTTGVNNQTAPTEDFLAGLTIEPLGRKLVIKNVTPELVGKLEACKFYIKSNSEYKADASGNRTILKPINDDKDLLVLGFECAAYNENYLHIQSKDNKIFKAFGPFYRSYNEFWGSNDFMGWDIEKEAIIGVPNTYEYTTYKEENSFDEDKVEWQPCSGDDISIPKYSNTKKLSYAFRKKAASNNFSSDIATVSEWDINYDLGSEISYGGDRFERFRGIYYKVAVFGKNEPTAVVDFTEYVRRGGSFDKIKIFIGRGDDSSDEKYEPIPNEVYEGKNSSTDTYILERPIKEGESILLSLDGKIRGFGGYGFVEEEALSHLDISPDGKWIEFRDALHNTEYEYSIDNSDYVRATRRRVKTGFDGTNSVTVKVRGRNWNRTTKREWIKTISNSTLDSDELKALKGRKIRVDLESCTVFIEKNKGDHYKEALPEVQAPQASDLSYLFGENDNGNYTSFDTLELEDGKYMIKLPETSSDALKGKKLFIKKGSAVITISFHDFHQENKIVPKKIIGINEIGPITGFTLIKEKNSDDDFVRPGSSEKYAHTTRHGKGYAIIKKNDATYILKNRPYTDDGYRKIFFDLRPGEPNIWYKRFDQTDYPIYIWNDEFEVNMATKPDEGILKDVSIEAYGNNQIVIHNVSDDLKDKLKSYKWGELNDFWNYKPLELEQLEGNDYLIKGSKMWDGFTLALVNAEGTEGKIVGPFKENSDYLFSPKSGKFLGWDAKESAILVPEEGFEYTEYDDNEGFDKDKSYSWKDIVNKKIDIQKYSSLAKKGIVLRKKAGGLTLKSVVGTIPAFNITHNLGLELEDAFEGIYIKLDNVGEGQSPVGVIDYNMVSEDNLENISYHIGKFVSNKESKKLKGAGLGKIVSLPVTEGDYIFLKNEARNDVRAYRLFADNEPFSRTNIDVLDNGKLIHLHRQNCWHQFEYKLDENSEWKRADRNIIETGYTGSPITVKLRGRTFTSGFTNEWSIPIGQSSPEIADKDFAAMKRMGINLDIKTGNFELKRNNSGLDLSSLRVRLSDENGTNSTELKDITSDGNWHRVFSLETAYMKSLRGKKIVIAKDGGRPLTIHFPSPEESLLPKPIQKEKTKTVKGLNEYTEICREGENTYKNVNSYDFDWKTKSVELTPGKYHFRTLAYQKDEDWKHILHGDKKYFYFVYGIDDLYMYFPSDDVIYEVKSENDAVNPPLQGGGSLGSGSIGGGNLSSGSTGGSENSDKNSQNKADDSKVTDNKAKADDKVKTDDKAKTGNTDNKNKEGDAKAKDNQTNKETDKPKAVKTTNTSINNVSASEKKVLQVLKNDSARLENVMSTGKVTINHNTLKNIFKDKAGELKTTLKVSAPKKNEWKETLEKSSFKKHTDYKPISKQVIKFTLKADNHEVKKKELGKTRVKVVVDIDLKKAPKEVFVMNVDTGEIVKATYNSTLNKLTFKAKDVGNFVVLNKVKGKTRVKSGGKGKKKKTAV